MEMEEMNSMEDAFLLCAGVLAAGCVEAEGLRLLQAVARQAMDSIVKRFFNIFFTFKILAWCERHTNLAKNLPISKYGEFGPHRGCGRRWSGRRGRDAGW
jgi:hypothetical protein